MSRKLLILFTVFFVIGGFLVKVENVSAAQLYNSMQGGAGNTQVFGRSSNYGTHPGEWAGFNYATTAPMLVSSIDFKVKRDGSFSTGNIYADVYDDSFNLLTTTNQIPVSSLGTSMEIETFILENEIDFSDYDDVYVLWKVTSPGGMDFPLEAAQISGTDEMEGVLSNGDHSFLEGFLTGGRPQVIIYSTDLPTASSVTITSPTNATSYESNPIEFAGLYTNVHTFNQIVFSLTNDSFSGSLYIPPISLPFTTAYSQPWSFERNLGFQGTYELKARLYDSVTGSTTPWTSTISFSLGTTTIATSTRDTLPGAPLPLDCSAIDIGCHLKNAVMWTLYPSNQSIENFKSLNENLKGRSPFIYGYETPELVNSLFNTSQTATTTISVTVNNFGTITFLSKEMLEAVPYASTVRTIISYIIWLGTVLFIYRKILKVHDNTTTT